MNLTLHFSQLNGLMSDIFSNVSTFFQNIFGVLFGKIVMVIYTILVNAVFIIMDLVQLLFRKFAGLDTLYVEGEATGDIVLTLINNPTVQNVFWSLVILALVLLVIVTIVALIKQETVADAKDKKSTSKILSSALRALLNFFMVPVVAILGIFMGNALLKSLDGATSGGKPMQISTVVFKGCAYECNRARMSETFRDDLYGTNGKDGYNNMGVLSASTKEGIADAIDEAFINKVSFPKQSFDFEKFSSLFSNDGAYLHLATMVIYSDGTALLPRSQFSIYDTWQVFYYYDLISYNYLVSIIASIFIIYVLFVTAVGLIKRIFKMVILLCISPVICSTMPLQGDSVLKNWRGLFIGSTLSAYSTIVTLNLTMLLIGPLSQIDFFNTPANIAGVGIVGIGAAFANNLVQLLILVAGLIFFKDINGEIAKLIGADDAYSAGGNATKAIVSKAAQGVQIAMGLGGHFRNKDFARRVKNSDAYQEQKADVDNAQKEYNAVANLDYNDPRKVRAAQNLSKAKKAFEDGAGGAAKRYEALAKARLNQSKKSFGTLATNGMIDEFVKNLDNKGVSDAKGKIKKKDYDLLKKIKDNEKAQAAALKQAKSSTKPSKQKMKPKANKTVVAPASTQTVEDPEEELGFKPTKLPGVRYTRSKNTYMKPIDKDIKPIEKGLKSKEGRDYISNSSVDSSSLNTIVYSDSAKGGMANKKFVKKGGRYVPMSKDKKYNFKSKK